VKIPFNKPHITGGETTYIAQAIASGKLSGDGPFTQKCQQFVQEVFGFRKALLTTSCTDALEMAGILLNIGVGDEVIMPSYTFVSTANAFALRGARIVFADSTRDGPNIDPDQIEALITPRTRAIVIVHYAGIACDMDRIQALAAQHGIAVIEDAAHAIDSYHAGRALGSLGTCGAFSFHDTKNIISGEGGMLTVNDDSLTSRAEYIREKGTNRAAFFRGEIDKYSWVSLGSSFLPAELIAAFLLAQLESFQQIQARRVAIWNRYFENLQAVESKHGVELQKVPSYATRNGHIFYLVCRNAAQREHVVSTMKAQGIGCTSHYLSLHKSSYFASQHDGRQFPNSDRYTDCLVRLPLYCDLSDDDVDVVSDRLLAGLAA
jgi:dTDP-4-amino-4,6-dideoxygalactose transaminase